MFPFIKSVVSAEQDRGRQSERDCRKGQSSTSNRRLTHGGRESNAYAKVGGRESWHAIGGSCVYR
jgi:hypothetical protein